MRRFTWLLSVGLWPALGCGDDGSATSETGTEGTADDTSTSTSTSTSTTTATGSTTDPDTGSSGMPDSSTGQNLCGNNDVDDGEECDDGNNENTDSCSADCRITVEELWTVSYNGPASNTDSFNDVVLDDDGNIYVVGSHRDDAVTNPNLIVKQYMPDGTEGWTYEYAGAGDDGDYGFELAWHTSGDLVIAGVTETAAEGDNALAIRLATADQTAVWVDEYDGPGMGMEEFDNDDTASSIAVDSAGNVIVAGSQRNDDEHYDLFVRKLDPSDGSEIWQQTFSGDFGDADRATGVAVDGADNIYVLGLERIAAQQDQGWLRKYDSDGVETWTQTVDWIANDIRLDADENIVLTGWGSVDTDVTVAKYDPDFVQLWLFSHQGPGNGIDFGSKAFIGDGGEVYVAGSVVRAGEQGNFWTAKLDADGNAVWATQYNNEEAGLEDGANGVAVDGNGDVIAVGYETVFGQQSNGFIRKLGQL